MENEENRGGLIKIDSQLLQAISQNAIVIKTFDEDILALESVVAGTSYLSLHEIEKKIFLNESKLLLEREPKNEYDEFAIKVLFEGQKIGYVPRAKNQTIARLMDAGKQFYAKVVSKEWEGKWLRMDLQIYLKD